MRQIKGFVVINDYINNQEGQISLLGEISPQSLTYSREKGEYFNTSVPGYGLISFYHKDLNTNLPIVIGNAQVIQILNIVKSFRTYSQGQIRPNDPTIFLNYITTEYTDIVSDLTIGSLIDNGELELPEWISWTDISSGDLIKIWLSDISFAEQYDEYEVLIVPQIDNVDIFFNSFISVKSAIESITIPEMMEKVNIAKNNRPATSIEVYSFDFVNTLNTEEKLPVLWWFLIYGKAGNNIDIIKEKLISDILNQSANTIDNWEVIFPELFKTTEFVILPRWDKISIENYTLLSSLYSSILNTEECKEFAKLVIPFYDQAHIEENINIMPYDYKALSLLVLNGPNNIETKADIKQLFNDYIPVPSTSLDFSRMSLNTQDWSLLIGNLLIAAETATVSSSTPVGMTKIKRNNILFISAIYKDVNYLVAARSNLFYNI